MFCVDTCKMLNNNTDNPPIFPTLTLSSINCNSLNMSVTSNINQKRKIYGITKLKSDNISFGYTNVQQKPGVTIL